MRTKLMLLNENQKRKLLLFYISKQKSKDKINFWEILSCLGCHEEFKAYLDTYKQDNKERCK